MTPPTCFRQLCVAAALLTSALTAVPMVAAAQRIDDREALVGHRARVTAIAPDAQRIRYDGVIARIDSTAVTLRCRDCAESLRTFRWSEVQAMEVRRARAASPGELLGNVGLGLLGGGLFGGALGGISMLVVESALASEGADGVSWRLVRDGAAVGAIVGAAAGAALTTAWSLGGWIPVPMGLTVVPRRAGAVLALSVPAPRLRR